MKLRYLLLLLFATQALAQSATISGTVTDTDSQLWFGGTWGYEFYPNPSYPNLSSYYVGNVPLSTYYTKPITGQMDATLGTFTMNNLIQNNLISPSGSQWTLKFCPQASSGCGSFLITMNVPSITGSTIINGITFNALITSRITAPRFEAVAGAFGYSDLEASGGNQLVAGSTYWNVTQACQRYYVAFPPGWSCGGGGGSRGAVSGQAANTIPLGTSSTVIGNQSHITDNGATVASSEPLTAPSMTGAHYDTGGAVFNGKAYGATGKGSTDDISSINAAIAALNTAGRGALFFPEGTYYTAACNFTTISAQVTIFGVGASNEWYSSPNSQINCASTTANLFTLAAYAKTVRDMGFHNTNGGTIGTSTAGAAIYVVTTNPLGRTNIENSSFYGFYDGVYESVGSAWHITGNHFLNQTRYCVNVNNTVVTDDGDWVIAQNYFGNTTNSSSPTQAAIAILGSGGAKIHHNKINAWFVDGIYQNATGSSQTLIQDNDIENVTRYAINMTSTWPMVMIEDNYIAGAANEPDIYFGAIVGNVIITGNLLETYATGAMTQYAVQFPSAGMTFTAVTNNVVNAFFAGQVNYGPYATPPYLQIGCGDSSCNDSPTLRLYSQVTGSSFYSQIVSSWAGNGLTFNLPRTLSGKGYHFQDSGTTDLFVIDSASGAGTFKGGISSQAATEDDGIGNASWKGNTFQLGCTASTCGNNVTLTFGSYVAGTGAVTNGITSSWAGDGIDFTLPRNLQGKGYYFKNNGGSATPVFFDATAPNGSFQVQQTYGQVNIGQMESYTIGTA